MEGLKDTQINPAIHSQDLFRLLNGLAIAAILYTQSELKISIESKTAFAITILFYILLCNITIRLTQGSNRPKIIKSLSFIDTLLIGIFVAACDFELSITITLITFSLFHTLTGGGWNRVASQLSILTTGATCFFFATPPDLKFEPSTSSTLFILAVFSLYLAISGTFLFRHQTQQSKNLHNIKQQMIQLKLRAYKLSKYLSPNLRKAILSGKEVKLETHRKKLTIFFSDIVGFSELAEEMDTEALTALLNNYLTEMSEIAIKFGGTIDKFIGDGIMLFYGDPDSRGPKTDCVACVAMAIAMKKHMKALQRQWANQGIQKPLEIRMGINTGYCTVGNFGTENRLDYTALGTEVNLASRLEAAAEKGEILISHETYSLIKDTILCEDKGEITVKGYHQPVKVYAAVDMRKNLGKDQAYFEHATNGFSVYMDVDKINNYDRQRILNTLNSAAKRLEEQPETEITQEK